MKREKGFWRDNQFDAGCHPKKKGLTTLFHTDDKGRWWCGWILAGLTARQLLSMCRSTEKDLLKLYPELRRVKN